MDSHINKVISMVIQDLRQSDQGYLIDLIKKSEYSLDFTFHDNWDGGIDFYRLRFHLKYSDYSKILFQKAEYEKTIEGSINSFYEDEQYKIAGVDFVAKIDQYVDWAAVTPKENKESVLQLINDEKDTLIKAGTGGIIIRDTKENEIYKKKHSYLLSVLNQLGLKPIHSYKELWDWYNDYNLKKLSTYQSRRIYIKDLFEPLITTIQNSEGGTTHLLQYEPTGWDSIDEAVKRMKDVLVAANATTDYQALGMHGRELLITLAQTVFIKEKHPSPDGVDIGNADTKRMLEAYVQYCLHKRSKEREVKFAKAAVDFSNELTHSRTANSMDAELCYNAVLSTVHIIRVLNKYND